MSYLDEVAAAEAEIDTMYQEMRNKEMRELADREGWSAAEYKAATTGDFYDQVVAEQEASRRAQERRDAEGKDNVVTPPLTPPKPTTTPPKPTTPATPPPVPPATKPTGSTVPSDYTPKPPLVISGSFGLRDEFGNRFDCSCALPDEHQGKVGLDGDLMKANMHTWLGKTCPPAPPADDGCCSSCCGVATPSPTPTTETPTTETPTTETPTTETPTTETPPAADPLTPLVFVKEGIVKQYSCLLKSALTDKYLSTWKSGGYSAYQVATCPIARAYMGNSFNTKDSIKKWF